MRGVYKQTAFLRTMTLNKPGRSCQSLWQLPVRRASVVLVVLPGASVRQQDVSFFPRDRTANPGARWRREERNKTLK